MAERELTPYPIYKPGVKETAPLVHLTLYARTDVDFTSPLEVLDPVTRLPLPSGFVTDAEGMSPYCILRGPMLQPDHTTMLAVDDTGRDSTQRLPLDPARILSDDQADQKIATAVAPLATKTELSAGLGGKVNSATFTSGMAAKADLQYVTDELGKKANTADVTSELAKKANATEVTSALAGKADAQSTADALALKASREDVTTATQGLATSTSVDEKIAAAQLAGADVDLSAYATSASVDQKISAAAPDLTSYATKDELAAVDQAVAGAASTQYVDDAVAAVPDPVATIRLVFRMTKDEAETAARAAGGLAVPVWPVMGGDVPTVAEVTDVWPQLVVGQAIAPTQIVGVSGEYSAVNLPAGLQLTPSGILWGTPTEAGAEFGTMSATSAGETVSLGWGWTVYATASAVPPGVSFSEDFTLRPFETAAQIAARPASNALGGSRIVTPTADPAQGNELIASAVSRMSGAAPSFMQGTGLQPAVKPTKTNTLWYPLLPNTGARTFEFRSGAKGDQANFQIVMGENQLASMLAYLRIYQKSGGWEARTAVWMYDAAGRLTNIDSATVLDAGSYVISAGDLVRLRLSFTGTDSQLEFGNVRTGETAIYTLPGVDVTTSKRIGIRYGSGHYGSVTRFRVFEEAQA